MSALQNQRASHNLLLLCWCGPLSVSSYVLPPLKCCDGSCDGCVFEEICVFDCFAWYGVSDKKLLKKREKIKGGKGTNVLDDKNFCHYEKKKKKENQNKPTKRQKKCFYRLFTLHSAFLVMRHAHDRATQRKNNTNKTSVILTQALHRQHTARSSIKEKKAQAGASNRIILTSPKQEEAIWQRITKLHIDHNSALIPVRSINALVYVCCCMRLFFCTFVVWYFKWDKTYFITNWLVIMSSFAFIAITKSQRAFL